MAKLRIVIADEDWTFLQKLRTVLEDKCDVVGTSPDGPSVVDLVRQWAPDVVVLGLATPAASGIEIIGRLAKQPRHAPVVVCAAETSSVMVESAMRAGAAGYVSKARIAEDLLAAVQSAHQGRSFRSENVSRLAIAGRAQFFKELGRRVRTLREKANYSQEDMTSFGFSARHWQQIETGRAITMTTLLRICETFKIKPEDLVSNLRDRTPEK